MNRAKHVAYAADHMIATDYSDGMIREAKKGYCPPNLTFEVCDAKDIPYGDDSFDAVIIANALHVMPDPEEALDEIDRVLKNDGILRVARIQWMGSDNEQTFEGKDQPDVRGMREKYRYCKSSKAEYFAALNRRSMKLLKQQGSQRSAPIIIHHIRGSQ